MLSRQTADPAPAMDAQTGGLRLGAQGGKFAVIALETEQNRIVTRQRPLEIVS